MGHVHSSRSWILPAMATLLCFLVSTASAVEKWTPDDILLAEDAGQFEVSPDGNWAVWVKRQMDKEEGKRIANLYLSSLTENAEIPLTRGKHSHWSPQWSPDGKQIAFLSSRPTGEGKEQEPRTRLWLIHSRGGEPWPVDEISRPVKAFRWRDAGSILFLAQEGPTLWEQEIERKKDTSRVVEDAEREPPVRLFELKLEGRKIRRVTANPDWIESLAVSPDGRWAATIHRRSLSFTFDHKIPPVLNLVLVDDGSTSEIEAGRRFLPRSVDWAPDSQGFYYTIQYSTHPFYFTAAIDLLEYYDLGSGRVVPVDLGWKNGLGGFGKQILPVSDGFLALLADGVRFRPARYRKEESGWRQELLAGDHVARLWAWSLGPDQRTLVYNHSAPDLPDQWYQAVVDGSTIARARQLTRLNPSFQDKPKHRAEIIRWAGANGEMVEGILHYPMDYQTGKKYPLMLSIHGGPSGTDYDAWEENWASYKTLLTQRGAFVLQVNYHGSAGYGLEWVESICCGKYYELERVDLENGVDHLINLGLVDPERLGTMGWSNGSILTTELITRSRRYKVASAGAGDVEWISDWANVEFGASFDNYYLGKAPYEDPDLYIAKSPYFRLKDVTTPTIIYTGTEDTNVPPSQSWSHFRVMQQATSTPVRFVLFPGEPHGLQKYQHQKRKVEEDLAWFDRHLFGQAAARNEAVKPGSPLDHALARARAARHGSAYGRMEQGVLIPETVNWKGLEVARFEVTRAQYAAFDTSYPVVTGQENMPASGVSFEQAKAYADWLSQHTGTAWRLPGTAEAEVLYGSSKEPENTLDYWAGYPPNPEDLERIRSAVGELQGAAPLLREVGSFTGRGEGDAQLFDLDGNVAEWTVGAEGQAVLKGGSADLPREAKTKLEAAPAYRGFRVVRGAKPQEGHK
jgi:dipeptidyl aminopeptidase/acylaminoacyl peptidase